MHPSARAVSSSKLCLDELVVALRAELQEYGGLLRLLHEEQDLIFTDHAGPEAMTGVLGRQLATARDAVDRRKKCMKSIGADDTTDQGIVTQAPVAMRPLLNALFAEVASVAVRVEVLADQNAWLRRRAAQVAGLLARRTPPSA